MRTVTLLKKALFAKEGESVEDAKRRLSGEKTEKTEETEEQKESSEQ